MSEENKETNIGDTDWSKLTFIAPKRKVEEIRDFPKLTKSGKLLSTILLGLGVSATITLIVITIIYAGPKNVNYKFDNGYGILGLIAMLAFILVVGLATTFAYFYDNKFVKQDNYKKMKALTNSFYLASVGFMYTALSFTSLRYAVLKVDELTSSWPTILLLVVVWLLVIAQIVLQFTYKKDKELKNINLASLIVYPCIIFAYTYFLKNYYSLGGFAFPLLISSVIANVISVICFAKEKKSDIAHVFARYFIYAASSMEIIAILYYGMIAATSL